MSARAIQDQKAIAPQTLVQPAVQGKAVVPAGAHRGIRWLPSKCDLTFSTIAEKKPLGEPLDGAFA